MQLAFTREVIYEFEQNTTFFFKNVFIMNRTTNVTFGFNCQHMFVSEDFLVANVTRQRQT